MSAIRPIVVLALAALVLGCTTAPREPEPTIAGDLTRSDIETVIADAMMVTASHLFRLLADDRIDQPDGEMEREGSLFRWSDVDMENTLGTIELQLENYRLSSELFRGDYRGYTFTGTVMMVLGGESADLSLDLESAHKQPEKYPVTRIELDLRNLEDDITPENVDGFIRANGHDVDVESVVRALQIGS